MLTLRELRTPLGYNQNAMLASDTNLLKTGQLSEGQRLQQNDAIVQNNTTEANYENAKNGMTGGVLPVMNVGGDGPLVIGQANPDLGKVADEALEERLNRKPESVEQITPQSASIPISANEEAYQDAAPSDASAEEKPLDIRALTDRLAAQQEAERAKFERRRMADRISRMGFALGNLVGAGGGKTDASAITLDDGTKQVGEYRKDMDEINKENQAAYQRALEQIYRKEDQDYKNSEALFKREQADIDNKRKDRVADAQIAAYNASAAQRNAAADANTMKAEAYVEKLASDLEKNKKYGDAAIARAAATALRAGAYAEYTRLMGQLKSNGVIKTEEVTDEYGKTKTKKVTTTPVTSGNTGSTAGGGKKTAYGNGGKKKSY